MPGYRSSRAWSAGSPPDTVRGDDTHTTELLEARGT